MKQDIFQATADPTRRAILTLIAIHALTPNAMAEKFDMSRQAVSKHIKVAAQRASIFTMLLMDTLKQERKLRTMSKNKI